MAGGKIGVLGSSLRNQWTRTTDISVSTDGSSIFVLVLTTALKGLDIGWVGIAIGPGEFVGRRDLVILLYKL
jgi:hypothetical protein